MIRVLVACEFSGVVRRAFNDTGFCDAWSCDLLEAEDGHPNHYKGDVFNIIDDGWDLMVAHPPCTYLCNSGVRWLHEKEGRWKDMIEGAVFFRRLMEADIRFKAIENPVMHKYAVSIVGRKHDFCVQPWQFGHGETKATCFWVEDLPELKPTNTVSGREAKVHKMSPSEDRWKKRSATYPGIAEAMAIQWGNYVASFVI